MIGRVGYKVWTGGTQMGLRIYAPAIRRLRQQMIYPSEGGQFASLDEWLSALEAGQQPQRYSRKAVIVLPTKEILQCTLTISTLPPSSPQGYVTAPVGTPFAQLVSSHLGSNIRAAFETSEQAETLILEPPEMKKIVQQQVKAARKGLRRLHQSVPRGLLKQGLYFEMLEYELRSATLGDTLTVDWRAPYIDSRLLILRDHNISCDIDIWDLSGIPKVCIEVKSVSGVPTSPFHLSRREFESREKCKGLGIEYEIVVYGFSNAEVDHRKATPDIRRVISSVDEIHAEPADYICW